MKQSESQCKEDSRKGETSLFKRETGKAWTEIEGEAKAWWLREDPCEQLIGNWSGSQMGNWLIYLIAGDKKAK